MQSSISRAASDLVPSSSSVSPDLAARVPASRQGFSGPDLAAAVTTALAPCKCKNRQGWLGFFERRHSSPTRLDVAADASVTSKRHINTGRLKIRPQALTLRGVWCRQGEFSVDTSPGLRSTLLPQTARSQSLPLDVLYGKAVASLQDRFSSRRGSDDQLGELQWPFYSCTVQTLVSH